MSNEEFGLAAIAVPGDPEPWTRLGFRVVDEVIAFRNGALRLGGDVPSFIVDPPQAASVVDDVDGVAMGTGPVAEMVEHPNGAFELDHVVLMTDSIDRTSAAVERALGLPQRRIRETEHVRQAFHRFADTHDARGCIIEVVERPDLSATTLWGLVVNVADLDAAVAAGAGLVGEPRDAVQPGRRIATIGRGAGLSLAVALMTP